MQHKYDFNGTNNETDFPSFQKLYTRWRHVSGENFSARFLYGQKRWNWWNIRLTLPAVESDSIRIKADREDEMGVCMDVGIPSTSWNDKRVFAKLAALVSTRCSDANAGLWRLDNIKLR